MARPGRETLFLMLARVPAAGTARFASYEDAVLPLLPAHGGELRGRWRRPDASFEAHLLAFESPRALERFRADDRRAAAAPLLAASGATTELLARAWVAPAPPPDEAGPARRASPWLRVWRTGLDPARAGEYERFARERSAPMFRRRPGFRLAVFAGDGAHRVVATLWASAADAAALASSDDYRRTVAEIERQGFLRRPQSVEAGPVQAVRPERA